MDRRSFFKAGAVAAAVSTLAVAVPSGAMAAPSQASAVAHPAVAKAATTPVLQQGSRGAAVKSLQNRLNSLGYWAGSADGVFGAQTTQAVLALQKAAGIGRDGVVGAQTNAKLNAKVRPAPRYRGAGRHIEIDRGKQIALFVENGSVKMIANTSTGGGQMFSFRGHNMRAVTPAGSFRIYSRYASGWQKGALGEMYKPVYFNGDIALHGSPSIPAYPVSHGCCRVSVAFMDMLWRSGWVNSGASVHVY